MLLGIIALLMMFAGTFSAAETPRAIDIPRLEGVRIDGDAADWGAQGYRVELMADLKNQVPAKADLGVAFRLAWDNDGLLAAFWVTDDAMLESPDEAALWKDDSFEIYCAEAPGSANRYAIVVSPGIPVSFLQLRSQWLDLREPKRPEALAHEIARNAWGDGYFLELRLPWANLGLTPKTGLELGFQAMVNDADPDGSQFQALWHPQAGARENANAMARLRLALKPGPAEVVRAWAEFDDAANTRVRVVAPESMAGQSARVVEGGTVRAQVLLSTEQGHARGEARLTQTQSGVNAKPWRVDLAGQPPTPLTMPDAELFRAQQILLMPMAAKPPVFKGPAFPECDFANPALAEKCLGAYRVKSTFYAADYRPVSSAATPGRYGAVLEIQPENGPAFKRCLTLFRAPDAFDTLFSWWLVDPKLSMYLAESSGLAPATIAAQGQGLGTYVENKLLDDLYRGEEGAVLFAGLFESKPDQAPATVYDDVWAMDRKWWVGLKRKLNGLEHAWPEAFVCPRSKEGDPAPEVRAGTPEEAGMKADTAERLDAVCKAWLEESQEPFAACVTRHGVAFFHQAYGSRQGEPLTTETRSWMASISKFLSGALMMTLVDQGRVDLDAPVDQYLPALRGIAVPHPLTTRHLYTHTGGLGMGLWQPRKFIDHWGDDRNDFEERVAAFYPHLQVGQSLTYNGAGHALGGKIIESVSGESLPEFFKRHLWEPLGCANTEATDGSAYTHSVPMDLAKFGQVMLNRGAYGAMRFFSEATFEKMLPVKLAPYVQFETQAEWGIGPVWMRTPGLSDKTFGHGAASSATLLIDPVNDLVIAITRDTAGKAFGKYHPQFIQAVVEGMQAPQ